MKFIDIEEMTEEQKMVFHFAQENVKSGTASLTKAIELLKAYGIIID